MSSINEPLIQKQNKKTHQKQHPFSLFFSPQVRTGPANQSEPRHSNDVTLGIKHGINPFLAIFCCLEKHLKRFKVHELKHIIERFIMNRV